MLNISILVILHMVLQCILRTPFLALLEILLKPEHQIKGLEAGEVIQTILREVPVPTV